MLRTLTVREFLKTDNVIVVYANRIFKRVLPDNRLVVLVENAQDWRGYTYS